ncbi:GerMN domain-containing protein [Aquibacillus koreensis]|uniref:GerMN domain-containing protein n=1 Tax=Aquibacillus koreensis TaxID=279446 RepID=A0A9X3WIG4_9BACI|nr:GerMN domain-containing protein [Aquibacillus koreensis]MCT2537916.1 GerMN domain-containing protein [Aquibacillus koreensis]MDC3419193.1 GerMN domain-containing protein [Aquibacillus koreensis]
MKKHSLWIYMGIISISLILLSGCGLFQGEQTLEEVDAPPEEASYTDDLDEATDGETDGETEGENEDAGTDEGTEAGEEAEVVETVERQLYLLDSNGMIVPQTVELPKDKEVAKQTLEYLVKGGPVTELLPNGFQAVLPTGTEIIGLNIEEDGTLVVDVSEEFSNYRPEDEKKIIEAMTFTLTQFDNVERITLWINGHEQEVMPVNGTPISEGYSRANGINIYQAGAVDLMDSKAVTLYYPTQHNDQFYHVPVTQHIEMDESDSYQSIVQALIEGPSLDLDLLNVFNAGVTLMEDPEYTDGILKLSFNENILDNLEEGSISNEVMETLVLTLTEQPGVDGIDVMVENLEEVFNEDGVPYSEPVTRDMFVPTGSM